MKHIFLAILTMIFVSGCGFQYSDGTRSGVVQNVSKKGLICKTWKAELALEGVRIKSGQNGSAAGTNLFTVHLPTEELANQFQAFEKSGQRVTVAYDEKLFPWVCEAESGYYVKSISAIK